MPVPRTQLIRATPRPPFRGRVLVWWPPRPDFLQVTARAAGLYRVSDPSVEGYEIYMGTDGAAIDFGAPPWQTAASLPVTFAAPADGHRYAFVVRRRNAWGVSSQNQAELSLELDGTGNEVTPRPSEVVSLATAPAAGATAMVTAAYEYDADGAYQADAFLVYLTDTGVDPDPDVDVAVEVAMVKTDGVARLAYTAGPYGEGDTVKAVVRTRRSGSPDVDSESVAVVSTTVTAVGPAAVSGGATYGGLAGQE